MRRLTVIPLLLLSLALAGCAGAEGQRAQELLEQAARAQDALSSATFEVELTVLAPGETFTATMKGGGHLRGERAGDMFVRMRMPGVPGAPASMVLVVEGGRAWLSEGSGWRALPLPPGGAGGGELDPAAASRAMSALVDSVEHVSVVEGKQSGDEPVTVVNGRIDLARMIRDLASGFAGLAGLPGGEAALGELDEHLGDVNVSLMISERSDLLVGALASTTVTGDDGEAVSLQLVYRLTSTNEPVQLPRVGG